MSDGKHYIKNKFELDKLDHDNHANRAERYLVYWHISATTNVNRHATQ